MEVPTSQPSGMNSPSITVPPSSTSRHIAPPAGGDMRIVSLMQAFKYVHLISMSRELICDTLEKLFRTSLTSFS